MTRSHSLFASLALLLATCAHAPAEPNATAEATPATDDLPLTIVGTSDLHGYLEPKNGVGGAALFGGYLKNLRRVRPVVLVDGGDLFQGTPISNLAEGAPVVRAMNALGYHAAAIGNHEFDYGPEGPDVIAKQPHQDPRGALRARAKEARFPLLGVNIVDEKTGAPVAWDNVHPSVIVKSGNIKVGIIGGTTEMAASTTVPYNVRGLRFLSLAEPVRKQAEQLRRDGAEVIVVTVHAGGKCRDLAHPDDLSTCDGESEVFRLARTLPKGLVDVIVGGHTHQLLAHRVNGIPIIQSGEYGQGFGRVDLSLDARTHRVKEARILPPQRVLPDATYEGQKVELDAAVAQTFAADAERATQVRARAIGVTLETAFRRQNDRESALGNLITDLYRIAVPEADLALNNGGGVRADLPAGPLTYGSLFELIPFDNRLAIVTVRAADLRALLARNLSGNFRIFSFSGIRAKARCGPSGVEIDLYRSNGTPLKENASYRMVTNDFLAMGGNGFKDLIDSGVKVELLWSRPLLRDVLAETLERRGGTLRQADYFDASKPRLELPGPRPICRR